jgi:DedD protein
MATRPAAPARKRAVSAEDGVADPALPQKKRARHRLIGAVALCLLAAVVVPLLLESEPSRSTSDVAIVIPSRDTPLPARTPSAPDAKAGDAKADDGVVARGTIDAAPAPDAAAKEASATDGRAVPTQASKADPKAGAKPEPRKDEIGALADAAQAKARSETTGRYVLQVGAFASQAGANAAVERVQASGLRAFTEKVKTDRGERVRVRVGPFASRELAEQARGTLKAAGIEAAVIAP